MPRKQSETIAAEPETVIHVPESYKPAKEEKLCGHENKHYRPPKELEGQRLFCAKPKGHGPEPVKREVVQNNKLVETTTMEIIHSSPYQFLRYGVLVDGETAWSDAAGTSVKK